MNNTTITPLPDSELEIVGTIPAADFESFRAAAIAELGRDVKLDGFRPGHVPENVLVKHLGEETILHAMAERAISKRYAEIIAEHKLDVLGRPMITLNKLALGNPVEFKLVTAVVPTFDLPNYRQIASDTNKNKPATPEVTDQEVTEVIAEVQKARANKETGAVPELTDEFAASLGDFKTVTELQERIKTNLTQEKIAKAKSKHRVALLEALAQATELTAPKILIETELSKMIDELRHEVERMNLKFEDYLIHLKKTEADLRTEWQADAVRRIKTSLLLEKIAQVEKIEPTPEELAPEVAHLKQHYPDASDSAATQYVRGYLINDKTLTWLENQA